MRKIKDYPIGVRLSIHILIIILLISLATISISGYFFNQHFNLEIQHDNENKLENTKEIVQILSEKALGIASTISEMELVKKAYEEFHKTGDLEKSRNMLIDDFTVISDKLSEELGIPARIHFHLPPARSMLRCWNGTGGDDLTSFRNTILEVSKSKKSVLGIEVGRAGLVIRGLSPIFSFEGEFVGSVEYMFPFSVAKQYLVSDKYELAFFIRKDISDDIRFFSEEYTENDNHQKVKYKILDSSSENVNLDIIYNSLIDKDITDTEMFKKGNYDYVMDPIYDFDNNIVGLVVYQEDISTYKAAFIKSNTILIGFVSLLAIISIFTIILIIRKIITNPLKLLSKVSKRHSLGDAKQEIDYYSENEVGVLASAFRELQSSMHIITNQAKTVSSGDYSTEIKPRSEKDELSIALNDMTKSLRKSSVEQKNLMAISEKLNIELQQVMNATSPLCAIDTDFNITRVNESFCDLFEKDIEKVIGEKCYNVINNEFCNTEKCVMKRILNSKNKVESISSCNLKNGNVTDLNIQSLPLKDDNNELIGIVENIKDITESVRAEREIKSKNEEIEKKNWLKTGQNELNELMSGDKNVINLSRSIITFLVKYVNAQIGTVYLVDETKKSLVLTGSYAYSVRKNINSKIKFGEGLVGQSAFEKEMITLLNVPDNYIRVNSSLGDAIPKNIIVSPFIFEDEILGVIELGSIEQFSEIEMEFIRSAMENIAIAVNSSISRVKLKDLLQKTQLQSEELQAQQEELRAANEELEEQTEELKASTEKLKTQQEELKATNEELEEKTESLERQSKEIKKQNKDIEKAKNDIENKAEDLAIASKYKSEFLANMSHELRTPLNSLLILSKDLADNTKENLTNRQVESAEIIYKSGNDLLHLINEILDLSKIEAGKITINIQEFMLHDLVEGINRNFKHLTDQKGLDLNVNVSSELDGKIVSDQQRIEQIIKNL
ncbi:MAG: GAF domain-containing protein, partial [Candidatus Cloacimonetes bacterium]|nr:GAF domain-containing protein [Candidatus Cloacimonadota bacterium]